MIDVRPTGGTIGSDGPGDCFKPEGCGEAMSRRTDVFLGDSPVVNPGGY